MHLGFALDLSDIDLLDTHLDLLDTDIPSKYFAFLHNVFKTSSRHVFKASSRHVFKTSSRHIFKTFSRRLQRNNFLSSKTSSICLVKCLQDVFKTYLQDVFKTSSRHLQDVLEDEKMLR